METTTVLHLTSRELQSGSMYRLAPAGAFTLLHLFSSSNAALYTPIAALLQGSDGSLYSTAYNGGGQSGCDGGVNRLSTSGELLQTYKMSNSSGGNPAAPLIQALDGNFYGTTTGRGTKGYGTAFRLDANGVYTVLHNFPMYAGDGSEPTGALVQATDGNFYGTTQFGGAARYGSLFQVTPDGKYKQLYSFPGFGSLTHPTSALVQHTNGKLYATAITGGNYGVGGIFELDMGLAPFVAFQRSAAVVGATAQILGQVHWRHQCQL